MDRQYPLHKNKDEAVANFFLHGRPQNPWQLIDERMVICGMLKARLNDAQTTQIQLVDAIVEQAVA
jgi:hypothetical protein